MTPAALSIVIAPDHDYPGWYQSVLSTRLNHDLRNVEIVTVDDYPDVAGGSMMQLLATTHFQYGCAGSKYVATPELLGHGGAIQLGIERASAPVIVVLESGTQFHPGVIGRLMKWFANHPESRDLVSGPTVHDDLQTLSTHVVDEWQMSVRGLWASAWETVDGRQVSIRRVNGMFVASPLFAECDVSDIPEMSYAQFPQGFKAHGLSPLGMAPNDEFEIQAAGLGMYAFRKEAWPGFTPNLKGMAYPEFVLHERFRRNGGRALCLGFARWTIQRDRGFPAPKPGVPELLRNYFLTLTDEGLNPIDQLRSVFVDTKLVTLETFNTIAADPAAFEVAVVGETRRPPARAGQPQPERRGPGTKLMRIYKGIGVQQREGCGGCDQKMRQMDGWGVKGCEENFWTIVGWMKDGMANISVVDRVKAAAWALANGLAFKVNWSDPFPDLIRMAIAEAAAEESCAKPNCCKKRISHDSQPDAERITG